MEEGTPRRAVALHGLGGPCVRRSLGFGGPSAVARCSRTDPQRTSASFLGVLITKLVGAVARQEFGGNVTDPLAGAHVVPVARSLARVTRCGFLCPMPGLRAMWLPKRAEAPASAGVRLSACQLEFLEAAVWKGHEGPMRGQARRFRSCPR